MNYFNLHLSLGICIGLVAIIVYCFYKTIEAIPAMFRTIKEYHEAQKELMNMLNNQRPFAEVLNDKSDKVIKNKEFLTVKHIPCRFVFLVNINSFQKVNHLLCNCICPNCNEKLQKSYIIMKWGKK